jgi:hypothetical protein
MLRARKAAVRFDIQQCHCPCNQLRLAGNPEGYIFDDTALSAAAEQQTHETPAGVDLLFTILIPMARPFPCTAPCRDAPSFKQNCC